MNACANETFHCSSDEARHSRRRCVVTRAFAIYIPQTKIERALAYLWYRVELHKAIEHASMTIHQAGMFRLLSRRILHLRLLSRQGPLQQR